MPSTPPLRRTYAKPALAPRDLLAHLASRGLEIADPAAGVDALGVLERIDYYRLLSYMRPLQELDPATGLRRFVQGTTMSDVVALYEFDRRLRLLCLDAVERIEVALRAAIVAEVAVAEGAHFWIDEAYYTSSEGHREMRENVLAEATHNAALRHYLTTYEMPEMPPVWVAMEAVSFGALSRFYSNLLRPYRRSIARRFGLDEKVLASWLRAVNGLRNRCAHHARVWNAYLHVNKPMPARGFEHHFSAVADRFFDRAVVVILLLNRSVPGHRWKDRLVSLLDRSPWVDPASMGFPNGWRETPLWASPRAAAAARRRKVPAHRLYPPR